MNPINIRSKTENTFSLKARAHLKSEQTSTRPIYTTATNTLTDTFKSYLKTHKGTFSYLKFPEVNKRSIKLTRAF